MRPPAWPAALLLLAACGGAPADPCAPTPDAAPEAPFGAPNVVGTGTPASCTGDAFVEAVARGGYVTFDCGPAPVTIVLARTAVVQGPVTSGPPCSRTQGSKAWTERSLAPGGRSASR